MPATALRTSGDLAGLAADAVEEWITRADAAALAGCSEDTIRRDERKHKLDTITNASGAVTLRLSDLIRIDRIRRDALTSPVAAESAEVIRARETITALKVQVAEVSSRLTSADTMIAALLAQLEQKDKQLASLTRAHEALVLRVPAGGAR